MRDNTPRQDTYQSGPYTPWRSDGTIAGDRRWGRVDVDHASRWLWVRVTVHPPATSVAELRWLTAWRWGTPILAILAVGATVSFFWLDAQGRLVLLVAAAGVAVAAMEVARRSAPCRHGARSAQAWLGPRPGMDAIRGRVVAYVILRLDAAMEESAAGYADAADVEDAWRECYALLGRVDVSESRGVAR